MPGAPAAPGFAVRAPRSPAPGALPVEFYRRPVLEVARDLIGCVVEYRAAAGMIVETEAYHEYEPACHAYVGLTPRTRTLFGGPGRAYVYRSYGIHALLNAVCEEQGVGAAVLIRALEPLRGVGRMRERRGLHRREDLCSGPGKLTVALAIGLLHNDSDQSRDLILHASLPEGWTPPAKDVLYHLEPHSTYPAQIFLTAPTTPKDAPPQQLRWSMTDGGKAAGDVALTVYMEFNGVPQ